MADVKITLTIPGPIYLALDAARKTNELRVERVNADGSRTIEVQPKYPSVEAQIQDEMGQRFSPYAAEVAKSDPTVAALETQLKDIQTQLVNKRTPAITVTKETAAPALKMPAKRTVKKR